MRIFVTNNNEIIHYGQRHQSHQSGACREKEIQPLAIQAAGMCANDRIEMVY